MDLGTKDHPEDVFGNPIEEGDTVAYFSHGMLYRGEVVGFTPKGARLATLDGKKTVLRDRICGPRSLEEKIL